MECFLQLTANPLLDADHADADYEMFLCVA